MKLSDEARLNAESRARILDVVIQMLIHERARLAYLCARHGINAADFFERPEVREELAPYLAAAADTQPPANLSGALDRSPKVRAFHVDHKGHVSGNGQHMPQGCDDD